MRMLFHGTLAMYLCTICLFGQADAERKHVKVAASDIDEERLKLLNELLKMPVSDLEEAPSRYTAQKLPVEDMSLEPLVKDMPLDPLAKDAQRFRVFRFGSKEYASDLANTNAATDLGLLKFVYGIPQWQSDFEDAVVGEYHVDVLSTDEAAKPDSFFGEYQFFRDGGDFLKSTEQKQPGFTGLIRQPSTLFWLTGGWYSFPKLGQCRWRFDEGHCQWVLRKRPRLVHFQCLQERLFETLKNRFTEKDKIPTMQEQYGILSRILSTQKMFKNAERWSSLLEAFLNAFKPVNQGGCPEVAPSSTVEDVGGRPETTTLRCCCTTDTEDTEEKGLTSCRLMRPESKFGCLGKLKLTCPSG